jgi:ABC-2 type transport system permease protein
LRFLAAFLKRDFLNDASYRFAFALNFVGILFTVTLWFFISRFLGKNVTLPGSGDTVDYFPYVLLGIAAMGYLQTALGGFSRKLRAEQLTGTLEALLATPLSMRMLVVGTLVWNFLVSSFEVILYVAIAAAFFDMPIHASGIVGFALALALSIGCAVALGMLSASFIIVFKRGDPVNMLITAFSALFGGVFFPAQVLPSWLEPVSKVVPLTYALDAMRGSLLLGKTLSEIAPSLLVLAGFCLVLLPVGVVAFGRAVDLARRNGTLVQY